MEGLPKGRGLDVRIYLSLFVLLLLSYIWGNAWYQLREAKSEAIAAGRRDLGNYARSLEEHTISTISAVDQASSFLATRYAELGERLDIATYMKNSVVAAEVFHQVSVIGADGELKLSNLPVEKINLSDREHFRVHQQRDSGRLFISKPELGRLSKKWSIQMSRRINDAQGRFLGVIVMSVDPEYFTHFYDELALGPQGLVTLAGEDGIVRARRAGGIVEVGQNISRGGAFKAMASSGNGTLVSISVLDKSERIFAFRKTRNYPMYVFVAVGTATVLQPYASRKLETVRLTMITSVLVLAFSLFVYVMIGRLIVSQQRALAADATKTLLLADLAQQQQALSVSSARLDAILQSAGDGIMTLGDDGAIESCNHAACTMFGYDSNELLNCKASQLMPLFTSESALDRLSLTSGVRRDGESLFLEMTARKVALPGKEKQILIVRDVSERQKVARLQQEFVSTVSHELRTPLTAIRGSLGLLQGGVTGTLPPQAQALVGMASTNAERLVRLINDLLDVQKLESGVLSMTPGDCSLPELIDEAVNTNAAYAARLGVRMEVSTATPSAMLHVDADRFQQVMANLLSNGCKYAGKHGVVSVACALLPEHRVRISVHDTGPGVPQTFVGRLFQKFSQADASNTKAVGGSGLGLSIAKAIVTQMHGVIGYQPGEGGGSCFYIELPVAP
jgi:PAS domain S-box-containing protein